VKSVSGTGAHASRSMVHTRPAVGDVRLRPYATADEADVLALLERALGAGPTGSRSAAFFRWKHVDAHFGPSYILVAESEGRLVGVRPFMRWRLRAGGRTVAAVRAVDTATDPGFQGRGVFSALTSQALRDLAGDTDLVFNTPNDKSGPGYLKLGWQRVGTVPVRIRPKRPMRLLVNRGSMHATVDTRFDASRVDAMPVAEVLDREADVDRLLSRIEGRMTAQDAGRWVTLRSVAFLRWRYAAAPDMDYRAVTAEAGGRLRGMGIFRVQRRGRLLEAVVTELLIDTTDSDGAASSLLRRIARAAPVDHLACSFAAGSDADRAVRRAGYLPTPGGILLVVNPLSAAVSPDPVLTRSWGLTLGDLEIF